MKRVPLTKGLFALVDDEDYDEVSRYKWHAQWNSKTRSYYAVRTEGKVPYRHAVRMSRQIMNTPNNLLCDHIKHDTLDNRKSELRNVTSSQNSQNRITRNNCLGHKNIVPHGSGYRVKVIAGNKTFLKTVRTLNEAIYLRDQKVMELQGEFSLGGV